MKRKTKAKPLPVPNRHISQMLNTACMKHCFIDGSCHHNIQSISKHCITAHGTDTDKPQGLANVPKPTYTHTFNALGTSFPNYL